MQNKIDIEAVIDIAIRAGKATLEVYSQDFEVISKEDDSPLTQADQRSNTIIIEGLRQLGIGGDLPVISEETKLMPYSTRKDWDILWLIDPLDGTKEFVKKNGEFTINIALVREGRPVLGVIYVPVQEKVYYAIEGKGAWLRVDGDDHALHLAEPGTDGTLRVVASRSHRSTEVEAYVAEKRREFEDLEYVAAGSSLKFCLVAEGRADVYPRLAPTMEWDTGAGHVIATEAGAEVVVYATGQPLQYNKEDLLNPHFIVRHPSLR